MPDFPKFQKALARQEKEISTRETYYIPRANFASLYDALQNDDIIGITTGIEGLDTSHTGIAIRMNGVFHLLHAPLAEKMILISKETIPEYLMADERQTGIMVARPLEAASS